MILLLPVWYSVETVNSILQVLGTVLDWQLKWTINTKQIVKRGQQKMFLLHKLNSFSVSKAILGRFYQLFIESFVFFICITDELSVVHMWEREMLYMCIWIVYFFFAHIFSLELIVYLFIYIKTEHLPCPLGTNKVGQCYYSTLDIPFLACWSWQCFVC